MKFPRGNERSKLITPNFLLLINACFTNSVQSQWRRLSALTVEESLEGNNTNFLENTGLQRGKLSFRLLFYLPLLTFFLTFSCNEHTIKRSYGEH